MKLMYLVYLHVHPVSTSSSQLETSTRQLSPPPSLPSPFLFSSPSSRPLLCFASSILLLPVFPSTIPRIAPRNSPTITTRSTSTMKTILAFSAAFSLLATLVSAQANGQYVIDPNSVPISTRDTWCTQQQSSCPLICLQTSAMSDETNSNACNATLLTYACVCSNGFSPNLTQYSLTLPYFTCTEWGNQCVANCGASNTACQSSCRQDHPCGAQSPTRVNVTSSSSSSASMTSTSTSATGSDTAATTDSSGATIYSGFAGASSTPASGGAEPGSAAASASNNGAAHIRTAALNVGSTFGVMGVAAVLFGGFAVLL